MRLLLIACCLVFMPQIKSSKVYDSDGCVEMCKIEYEECLEKYMKSVCKREFRHCTNACKNKR